MRKIRQRTFSGTTDNTVSEREKRGMACARRAAADGIVLLKNENHVLPVEAGSRIALYGSGAAFTIKGGTGSGDVNERRSVSILEGLENAGYLITSREWIDDYDSRYQKARVAWRDDILERSAGKSGVEFFKTYATTPFVRPTGGKITGTDVDTAFYVISRVAGEGADRYDKKGDYLLTDAEEQELADVCANYKEVVVILNTGGVMDLSFMDRYANIDGLIDFGQAGMEGGNALADIISGKVNPSGKLAATLAFHYEDYPNAAEFSHNNGNLDQEYYNEGIYVGYRYFDSWQKPVRYGFGFGLSYTTFGMTLKAVRENEGRGLSFDVDVKNTGNAAGREVAELYVSCPQGTIEKEYRRLAAFAKTGELKSGESATVTLDVPFEALASYDEGENPGWVLEDGLYGFYLGNSLEASEPAAAVTLDKTVCLEATKHICTPEEKIEEFHCPSEIRNRLESEKEKAFAAADVVKINIEAASIPTKTVTYRSNAELADPEGLKLADTLKIDQIKKLATGDPGRAQETADQASAGIGVPGAAAETSGCAKKDGIAAIVLADGPAGLRLNRSYTVRDGQIVPTSFKTSLAGGFFETENKEESGTRYYQYCTAFPVGTVLAQTWDRDMLSEVGRHVAEEMKEFNVTLWLAPGMCIQRNPLCGRNFEYYSEDPFITGQMAAAITKGVQSVRGCGTTIKHFACNNSEDNRMGVDCIVSERALREIYLKGFEIAIKDSQPMAIMTSYNKINGIHSANNYDLCTNAARNEFGFEGMIMTDWTTTHNGPDCTASGCMRAGNDVVMPGCENDQVNLTEELASGALKEEDLKACVSRLVRCVMQSNEYADI